MMMEQLGVDPKLVQKLPGGGSRFSGEQVHIVCDFSHSLETKLAMFSQMWYNGN